MSPSVEQVAWAHEALAAMAQAAAQGRGAVKDQRGEMIDLMHIKLARKILDRAARISDKARP
jgi:citrate lyase beta subunit